ncbi:MAG TPA: protein-tyrosine-phosphatase [Verrucomicrobiales bacterium]|nr:protein-tyrosine-phosphatase [Pedosphaera sp.]RZO70753.1 MAG: protein-tyrosine-phosphatase [Limisphaerales bacterium]HAO67661.1 protein-tyrosine-phosphatase [Verrucomicrobiales bacterium]HAQ97821.1 protein-tyrosine-phosphatase [Verrucomicrobiales bacterium]|tara:strand:+ start:893 stop:1621 length:729 start_codon:yes stop_codon:yes gene_type:complete
MFNRFSIFLILISSFALPSVSEENATRNLRDYYHSLEKGATNVIQTNNDRTAAIRELATQIVRILEQNQQASLTFICTHNSRRSQIAQVMATAAAQKMKVPNMKFYSGGTEETACNSRTVEALRRVGFPVVKLDQSSNPRYILQTQSKNSSVKLFSKKYNHPANPNKDFVAVMVCSDADENCPLVRGAISRVSLPYKDPKHSDNTDDEETVYDKKCYEIGVEQFALLKLVSQSMAKLEQEIK